MRQVLVVSLAALALAGCGSGASAGGDAPAMADAPVSTAPAGAPVRTDTVTIKAFTFHPGTVVVKRGARLRFANDDAAAHTATADDRSFDTQTIDRGRDATVTFMTPGRVPYHCDFHPFMKGVIVVE